MMSSHIEIYQASNGAIEVRADLDSETIWASLDQIAKLFDRDKSGISRHIKNIFASEELEQSIVVAIFATTASDGKTYQVDYYNLDMIISIGYRVSSKKATKFRQWATGILRQYITSGYAIDSQKITHQRFKELEINVNGLKSDMQSIKSKIKDDGLEITQGIFYNGQVYDAYALINDIFKTAKDSIVLIDNYVDDTILTLFSKYPKLSFTIITQKLSKQFKLDSEKYNKQYKNLTLKISSCYHDRFLIIDGSKVYHIGASLKDLGKKVFAFSQIDRDMLKWVDDE